LNISRSNFDLLVLDYRKGLLTSKQLEESRLQAQKVSKNLVESNNSEKSGDDESEKIIKDVKLNITKAGRKKKKTNVIKEVEKDISKNTNLATTIGIPNNQKLNIFMGGEVTERNTIKGWEDEIFKDNSELFEKKKIKRFRDEGESGEK
jgi:hypothetical protein